MRLRNQQGLGHTWPCRTRVESVTYPKSHGESWKVVCKTAWLDLCFRSITYNVGNEWTEKLTQCAQR